MILFFGGTELDAWCDACVRGWGLRCAAYHIVVVVVVLVAAVIVAVLELPVAVVVVIKRIIQPYIENRDELQLQNIIKN